LPNESGGGTTISSVLTMLALAALLADDLAMSFLGGLTISLFGEVSVFGGLAVTGFGFSTSTGRSGTGLLGLGG
jgi:hypothetical protein